MFTVILFREGEAISLGRYQFVFQASKMRRRIALCEWRGGGEGLSGNALQEMFAEINILTREHAEWKLIIYDGAPEHDGMDVDMERFIRLFSPGRTEKNAPMLEGDFPAQIFYIFHREKEYIPLTSHSELWRLEGGQRFPERFRMFFFEVEMGSGKKKSDSQFRLSCAILSLALGGIPFSFLEAGYLYRLDIEISRELFAEFVTLLGYRLNQIRERQSEEWENLKMRWLAVTEFPESNIRGLRISDLRNQLKTAGQYKTLSFREMIDGKDVESAIEWNREWLRSQMFFPKGVLHEKGKEIQRQLSDLGGAQNFLSEAGKERLKKERCDCLCGMREKKEKQLKQKEFEDQVQSAEDMIRMQTARIMKKKERGKLLGAFWFAELMILEPFVMNYGLKLQAGRAQMAWLCLAAALGIGFIIRAGYLLYLYYHHLRGWRFYKKKIFDQLINYQNDKLQYFEEILNLMLKFQYLEGLDGEQRLLSLQWNENRGMLRRHYYVLKNREESITPLKQLLGVEEQAECPCEEVLNLDFEEEPREEEYNRAPFQKERYYAELNHSGYEVEVAFAFIRRLLIKKATRNRVVWAGEDEGKEDGD